MFKIKGGKKMTEIEIKKLDEMKLSYDVMIREEVSGNQGSISF